MTTDWQKAQNVFPELKQIKAEWDSIHKAQVGHDSFAELTFCSKEVAKGLSDIITYGGADQLLPCRLYGSRTAC